MKTGNFVFQRRLISSLRSTPVVPFVQIPNEAKTVVTTARIKRYVRNAAAFTSKAFGQRLVTYIPTSVRIFV